MQVVKKSAAASTAPQLALDVSLGQGGSAMPRLPFDAGRVGGWGLCDAWGAKGMPLQWRGMGLVPLTVACGLEAMPHVLQCSHLPSLSHSGQMREQVAGVLCSPGWQPRIALTSLHRCAQLTSHLCHSPCRLQ